MHKLLAGDPLRHYEGLVGLANSQPPHEPNRRISFRDKAERGERREQESVRRRIDEVRKGDERCGETDCGPVQRGDEDLRVRVESMGDVEVVGDEILEPMAACVVVF